MLTLRSSPASPFGRKVKIAAAELGLTERITVVVADTTDSTDALRQQNPLGKIPTLILETGETLFDSRVIVEYLDDLAGGGAIFPQGPARFQQLRLQALADGLADAALLLVYEGRYRPAEQHNQGWMDLQSGKVSRALTALEAAPPTGSDRPGIGDIALACALGYLDLRFAGRWRAEHPGLVAWLDAFAASVPSFETTRFKG